MPRSSYIYFLFKVKREGECYGKPVYYICDIHFVIYEGIHSLVHYIVVCLKIILNWNVRSKSISDILVFQWGYQDPSYVAFYQRPFLAEIATSVSFVNVCCTNMGCVTLIHGSMSVTSFNPSRAGGWLRTEQHFLCSRYKSVLLKLETL